MQYVWSTRYVDAPLIRDRDSDGDGVVAEGSLGKTDSGLDERLFYCFDANFNITSIVLGTPDDADLGKVVERYACDPYGKVLVLDGADGVDPDTTAGDPDEHVVVYKTSIQLGPVMEVLERLRRRADGPGPS